MLVRGLGIDCNAVREQDPSYELYRLKRNAYWYALFFLLWFPYNYSMLSEEEVKKVATLARIELSDSEVEKFQKDLSSVLDYVEELKQVDTEGLDIVASVTGLENVERADEAVMVDYQEDIMKNAPERKDKYYKVKSIL